jgi:hypothetical protein
MSLSIQGDLHASEGLFVAAGPLSYPAVVLVHSIWKLQEKRELGLYAMRALQINLIVLKQDNCKRHIGVSGPHFMSPTHASYCICLGFVEVC